MKYLSLFSFLVVAIVCCNALRISNAKSFSLLNSKPRFIQSILTGSLLGLTFNGQLLDRSNTVNSFRVSAAETISVFEGIYLVLIYTLSFDLI